MIVTLDEIKLHLRYDTDDNDAILELYYQVAMAAILEYVTDTYATEDDYPPQFKYACLILIGWIDEYRTGDGIQKMQMGADTAYLDSNYMPSAVRNLLYPFRKPTVL